MNRNLQTILSKSTIWCECKTFARDNPRKGYRKVRQLKCDYTDLGTICTCLINLRKEHLNKDKLKACSIMKLGRKNDDLYKDTLQSVVNDP